MQLKSKDFIRAALTAVVAGVFFALYNIVSQPGFDLFTVDYVEVGRVAINAAVAAFIGFIGVSFGSNKEGKFLGKIG